MKLSIYSIYDKVSGEFGPIWLSKTDLTAQRQFKTHLSTLATHMQQDFELQKLGHFDNEVGMITVEKSEVIHAAE